jgi:M6 family metalloprotease-like protein
VVGVALAWLASPSDARAATCTFEQKQTRNASLAVFQRSAVPAKRTYFRKHASAKQRAAFVKAQQKKLRALRTSAGCSVPPLPPSSAASCSFMLAPNAENERFTGGYATLYNEGPNQPGLVLSSLGHVNAVMLFVDFADHPGSGSIPDYGALHTAHLKFFEEASYGRFSLSVDLVDRWFRMPQPSSSYNPFSLHQFEFVEQAIRAADPFVDFARYDFVFFGASNGTILANRPHGPKPGFGVLADGKEIRFAAIIDSDVRRFGTNASFPFNHEFSHTLGLPDLGSSATGWDPMAATGPAPWPSGAHFVGWHKWKLGWLDPPQLTCLQTPGQLEETLTPLAVAGGKKLVVVPITDSIAYVVEVRRPIGYDKFACEEGVLVYSVDSQLLQGDPLLAVKGPPACGVASPGALATGDTFEDPQVKVEVLASDGRDYRVRVTKK